MRLMLFKNSSLVINIFMMLLGASLVLAFAPFNVYYLALLVPILLLFFWLNATPRQAFWRGWFFGLGFFGAGVSWVYVSIHTYGQAPTVLALIITLAFIFFLALFPALQGFILARYFPVNNLAKYLLAFPALWVLGEWLREWLFTGFPWLYIGYTQLATPLHAVAPIGSVYLVSWATLFTSGALMTLILAKNFKQFFLPLICIIILWACCIQLEKITWTHPSGMPIKVSMIQGNVPQELKWRPEQVMQSLSLYHDLTQRHWDSNIIFWPEAAITLLQNQATDYLNEINKEANAHHATVITGIPIFKDGKYYNGAIALGNGQGNYLKRHLVPFGEFMPFRILLGWLNHFVLIPMSDFSSGANYQPLMLANNIPLAMFICYEIAYPSLLLNDFPKAQLIVVLTDDSWFGRSFAPAQHIQMAQMRALETGRYLISATNNGITAIISPQGKIEVFAIPFSKAVLSGTVQAEQGSTPWIIIGIYPVIILMLLLLAFAWMISLKSKN